ncbi:MAG: hypothetical protein ACLTLQ_02075 [[Clostridium] scindens]
MESAIPDNHFSDERCQTPTAGRDDLLGGVWTGIWYFAYASNPALCVSKNSTRREYDCHGFDFASHRFPDIYRRKAMTGTSMSVSMSVLGRAEGIEPAPGITPRYNPVGGYVKYYTCRKALEGKPRKFLSAQGVETSCSMSG